MTPELQAVADALNAAAKCGLVLGLLLGALSMRTWDFIRDLHWQWRRHRHWLARRRRQQIQIARGAKCPRCAGIRLISGPTFIDMPCPLCFRVKRARA